MGRYLKASVLLGFSSVLASEVMSETVPRILTNFPATQDKAVKQAFSERIRATFPKDIRTSTLTALLEMDGFTVLGTEVNHTAHYVDADFPCITDYTLTWDENQHGYVADFQIDVSQKCV